MFRPSTMEDARFIATNMRRADRQECEALTGAPPEIIIPQFIGKPGVTTWEVEGVSVAIGGIDPSIPKVGVVWMATTNDIIKYRIPFLRLCRPFLRKLHKDYPILTNLVDARNTLHIRWLKWLGFVFTQRIERWGAHSVPFLEFARFDSNHVSST